MASGWHNKLARLSRMDAAEVTTRLGQSIRKHGDWVRYRLGMLRAARVEPTVNAARGKFFFETEEARRRAVLVKTALPAEAAATLREADEICRHRFRLLGYEGLDYGAEIDWHLDAAHQKRAPLRPWFKIPFLDFAEVGDHKVTWELNRHQHLVTLAKAGLLTGDARYVAELVRQWEHWQAANPYPMGINWASSLEVAFRTLSWIWVDHLIPDGETSRAFRAALRAGLAEHGRYIEKFLSTYFSPNTHLLGEVVALFFLGTLYPGMNEAERWRSSAWKVITEEARRQVRPDGVYFEQSLHYHVYALDFFLHARVLAELNGTPAPLEFDSILNRMLDVVEALAQAGPAEGFGDDDGGRVFNSRRNQTEQATDPLAVGSVAYRRKDLGAARLTEEAIWLFGEQAVTWLSQEFGRKRGWRAFPDGGIYALVGAQPVAHELVIDAGPQGVGRCGHGHADALSLRLTAGGGRWLIDSGSGVYIGADRSVRDAFRGTAGHNTLRVDGQDQAGAEDPFSWTNIPRTTVERWAAGETFQFFSGSHDGYVRSNGGVVHRRSVLWLHDGLGLVRDEALGGGQHDLELNWLFAPGIEVSPLSDGAFARRGDCEASLQLHFAGEAAWQHERVDGECSPAYGRFERGVRLRSRASVELPAEIGTLLMFGDASLDGSGREDLRLDDLRLEERMHGGAREYRFRAGEDLHVFCFSTTKDWWQAGSWSSDAEAFYCRTRGNELTHLVIIRGSRVRFGADVIMEAAQALDWFEWSKQGSEVRSAASAGVAPSVKADRSFELGLAQQEPASYAEKR